MSLLLRLELKQKFLKRISNSHFLFRSYSFGIETITKFTRSRSSLENHTRFQTKMGKMYTRFQAKNHTLWGGTYLYGLYKGVSPSPGDQTPSFQSGNRSIQTHALPVFHDA